jgi:hypothetical protein
VLARARGEAGKARVERALDLVLELVRALAEVAPAIAGQLGHALHEQRQLAARACEARIGCAQRMLAL